MSAVEPGRAGRRRRKRRKRRKGRRGGAEVLFLGRKEEEKEEEERMWKTQDGVGMDGMTWVSRIVRAPMLRALAPVDIQLLYFLFAPVFFFFFFFFFRGPLSALVRSISNAPRVIANSFGIELCAESVAVLSPLR